MGDPVADLRAAVDAAAGALGARAEDGASAPVLERPPKAEFGDYSTNAAMLLAPTLGEQPRGIAERLAEELRGRLQSRLERVEVAGPGFLNLFLSDDWYRRSRRRARRLAEELGRPVGAERGRSR